MRVDHLNRVHRGFNLDVGVISYFFLLSLSTLGIFYFNRDSFDDYDLAILVSTVCLSVFVAYLWKSWRIFSVVVFSAAALAVLLYDGKLEMAEESFWLKYMLSSQSAILWSCFCFLLSTLIFWLGLIKRSDFLNSFASILNWSGAAMGLIGLLVRWKETYLISPEIGYIPISNLYEVSILFCVVTALIYQFFAQKMQTNKMGSVVSPIISICVIFIIWYSLARNAHQIQPLIPALQSWWMKLHVPANFIGYGGFAIAAMLGIGDRLAERGYFRDRMPSQEIMREVMYRAIAVGFIFFTIATILGAMWAAEAWGSYWSWDPKETWALIVWINYAAWLHVRLVKDWSGAVLAWWAIIGLFVTTFAFIGVNIFLSGLHSYGSL